VRGWGQAGDDTAECTSTAITPGKFFLADDRIGIDAGAPLKAGDINELTLVLRGPSIECVTVQETGYMDSPVSENLHIWRVRRSSSGAFYVPFTPTRLGEVGVRITGTFPDGGLARLKAKVNSVPSDREPALLMMEVAGPGRDTDMWRLALDDPEWKEPDHWFHFWSSAYYLDSKLPAEIDRSYLRFSVKQPLGDPVVEMSEDGGLRPLRVGDALLETRFGNATRETCIQVRENSVGGDNSRCGELRAPEPDAPLNTVWIHNPDGLDSHIGAGDYFVSRIAVAAPSEPVGLAQPLDIPMKVTGGDVRFIAVRQKMKGSDASISSSFQAFPEAPQPPRWPGEQARVVQDDGETKTVEFTPAELGEETVSIVVEFKDGGFDERFFHIRTVPSDLGLEQIQLDPVALASARPRLRACLKYTQLARCIFLDSLDGLQIAVDPLGVVRVDPDGTVHELSVGTAKVTVSIGNVQQSGTLHVVERPAP
jgi:hypothetical protein